MENRLPNSLNEIEHLDVLNSTRLLADQIEDGYNLVKSQLNPQKCQLARRVIICGMGGSALAGRVVKSIFESYARCPLEIINHYQLPQSVGNDTLVIISSYSGNTEEIISVYHQAVSQNAQIFIITSGGKLSEMPDREIVDKFIFNTDKNPSKQPRLGTGYSLGAILAILSGCDFISLSWEQLSESIKDLRNFLSDFAVDKFEDENPAKKMALALFNRFPVLIASEHLVGSIHVFKNQLNETDKNFAVYFDIPELNHHLMEGLKRPPDLKKIMIFVFFVSNLYHPQVIKRYPLTKEVVEKQEIATLEYHLQSQTRLSQSLELLALSSYVQFYLAYLYKEDPSSIPWVDYFKKSLANNNQ